MVFPSFPLPNLLSDASMHSMRLSGIDLTSLKWYSLEEQILAGLMDNHQK
jgi:hypothetical protein